MSDPAGDEIRSIASFMRHPLHWDTLALAGQPAPREWAIANWLGMAFVTLLAGLGGIGKTLLAQMIGSAITLGRGFIDEVPSARKVLMWAAEDDRDELWRRQIAIATYFGVGLEAFAAQFIVESFADRDCTLMDLDLGGRLVKTGMLDELEEQIGDHNADVVILDNAARMFGGKESDRNQVTRFMAALNSAARRGTVEGLRAPAILLLAHPGRAQGSEYSGSSAWENAARARMFLSDRRPDEPVADNDEPTGEIRYLAKRKTNYSARDLRTFRYEDGVLKPQETAGARDGPFGYLENRRNDTIVLDAFKRLTNGLAQQPTDGETSPNYLPKLILQFKLGDGRTRRDLGDAMRRLMTDGILQRQVIGQYAAWS